MRLNTLGIGLRVALMPTHDQIVRLAVAGLVFAILFPIVMTSITTSVCKGFPNNSTTIPNLPAWCSGAVGTVFTVLFPILTVIGVVLLFVKSGGNALLSDAREKYETIYNEMYGTAYMKAQAILGVGFVSENEIVGIAIAALLLAILFPIVMASVTAPSTALWGTATTTIFQTLFPVILIVSAVLLFVRHEHTSG